MWKILILFLTIIIICVLICNTKVFPLSAGSIDSGTQAIKSIKQQTQRRKIYNYPLVAIIVEPRKDNLVNILQHFITKMPDYTHFQVYHGTNNKELILNNFKNEIMSNKISLWNLGVANLTIQGYSALFTSKEFWNSVQGEKVLVFQTDAITCGKSKFNITDFLEYDYVGAPIPDYLIYLIHLLFICKGIVIGHNQIYNGGLSFRSKSKMLKVIENYPWDKLTTEDVWFCVYLPRIGGKLPPKDVAQKFSFEADYLTTIPWGLHKPRKEYDTLCKICPEVKNIPYIESHTDYRNLYLI
jgi:hypothetical protein